MWDARRGSKKEEEEEWILEPSQVFKNPTGHTFDIYKPIEKADWVQSEKVGKILHSNFEWISVIQL